GQQPLEVPGVVGRGEARVGVLGLVRGRGHPVPPRARTYNPGTFPGARPGTNYHGGRRGTRQGIASFAWITGDRVQSTARPGRPGGRALGGGGPSCAGWAAWGGSPGAFRPPTRAPAGGGPGGGGGAPPRRTPGRSPRCGPTVGRRGCTAATTPAPSPAWTSR